METLNNLTAPGDQQFKQLIELFLAAHLSTYTAWDATVDRIALVSHYTEDPGNEHLLLVFIAPKSDDTILEDPHTNINLRGLNNKLQQQDWANEDHACFFESPIQMNTEIILPFTACK